MLEYIDREKLLEDIEHTVIFTVRKSELAYGESRGAIKVINRIEAAPSADVVEVVRCKNCKFQEVNVLNCGMEWYKKFSRVTYLNDYCSYGERKDGDEE